MYSRKKASMEMLITTSFLCFILSGIIFFIANFIQFEELAICSIIAFVLSMIVFICSREFLNSYKRWYEDENHEKRC